MTKKEIMNAIRAKIPAWNGKLVGTEIVPVEVTEPPCSGCRYWRPEIVISRDVNSHGLHMCQSPEQHHDFSCFDEKGAA